MDIVGYSKLPMDQQEQFLMLLQNTVRQTAEFVRASAAEELIRIPTGDGMALVFFWDAEAPVRCALELSQLLRSQLQIKLRMGVHSGPVYRVADINLNRNVAGGGINLAQRVMDSGDAGHILVSSTEAEVLSQISTWSHMLHDLGEVEVKHGVRLKIYNLYSEKTGNPELPKTIAAQKTRLKIRYLSATGAIAVLVLALLSGWLLFTHRAQARLSSTDTIVLADFSNITSDKLFNESLMPPLKAGIVQSTFLNILSDDKVRQTLQQMTRPSTERLTRDLAREVCQRAGSKAYLAPSIAEVGTQYSIELEVLACASGDVLASEQVTASGKDQVVARVGQAASQIREKLGESLNSVREYDVPLAQATTSSLEALDAYSRSRKTSSENAILLLENAVEIDPNFAMAYDLLGNIHSNLNHPIIAADYLKKAFDLRNRATRFEKLRIEADYYSMATGELEKANRTYELWIQLYPRVYDSRIALGVNYTLLGKYDKAAAEAREALRLDPFGVAAYPNLAGNYLALDRFDEASATIADGLKHKIEVPPDLLYALAFLRGDVTAMKQQADEAIRQPDGEGSMLSEESDTEAWSGRLGKARELSSRAWEMARSRNEIEDAAVWQANAAIREALFGNASMARKSAAGALKIAPGSRDAEAQAALAYVFAGDDAGAQPLVDDLTRRFQQDTVLQSVWLPVIRAQMEMGRKNASRSLELLRAAAPYELGFLSSSANKSCLYPVYVRAQAYLDAGGGPAAVAEFQKILDHRGLLSNCATGPLAHLGLARAYVLEGATDKARSAYQDFFGFWKKADADIPILIAAKSEYSKLN